MFESFLSKAKMVFGPLLAPPFAMIWLLMLSRNRTLLVAFFDISIDRLEEMVEYCIVPQPIPIEIIINFYFITRTPRDASTGECDGSLVLDGH